MTIESKVKRLYRPAIDAYMASLPGYFDKRLVHPQALPDFYYPDGNQPANRSAYGYLVGFPDSYSHRLVIEPPAEDGTGGGRVLLALDYQTFHEIRHTGDSDHFVTVFEDIRRSIDNEFRPFHNLPKPSAFSSELAAIGGAISALSLDFHEMGNWGPAQGSSASNSEQSSASTSGRTLELPSELLSNLNIIFGNLSNGDAFSGNAILPLKARYVTGLQISTRALCGLLYVYGGHIAAEQEIWRRADRSLNLVLDKAHDGFSSVVLNSSATVDWKQILTIVGVASDGMALLTAATGVGAAGSAAIGVVGLGVKTVGAAIPPQVPTDTSMASYGDVVQFMKTATREFRSSVVREEQLIEENVASNLASIADHSNYYDLKGPIFDDQNRSSGGGHDHITWLPSAAAEVSTSMRAASSFYAKAGDKLTRTSIWDAARRPYLIGTSTTGPAKSLDDLGSTLRALLLALGAELELGATNVDGATDLFIAAEEEYIGKITALESELDLTVLSMLESEDIVLDPLAPDAPEIAPLDIAGIMGGKTNLTPRTPGTAQ